MKPSKETDKNKTALLVVDVQQGLFETPKPVYKADELLENINTLIDRAHAEEVPVIYIQHCGEEILLKGTPAWEIHSNLRPLNKDTIVLKRHPNAFEETSLEGVLKAKQVNKLVITGLVTHGCVKATCLGALSLGYEVVLVEDAHSNLSKQAATIIEAWNQKLVKKGAELRPTASVVFTV